MRRALNLYCIALYFLPVLNPKSYDGARVLEASGRLMLVIGRSYGFVSIQEGTTKLADEITEQGEDRVTTGTDATVKTGDAVGMAETVGEHSTEITGKLAAETACERACTKLNAGAT